MKHESIHKAGVQRRADLSEKKAAALTLDKRRE